MSKVPLEFLPQTARSKMRKGTLMGLFFAVPLEYALMVHFTGPEERPRHHPPE